MDRTERKGKKRREVGRKGAKLKMFCSGTQKEGDWALGITATW